MKAVLGILLLAAAALGVWVAAGPFLTIRAIDSAVHEKDQSLLEDNVDFPTLRSNLKPQIHEQLVQRAKRDGRPIVTMIADAYAEEIAERLVDALITPEGIGALLDNNSSVLKPKKKKKKKQRESEDGVSAPKVKQPTQTRWFFVSPNEFAVKRSKGLKSTTFVLERHGLVWKLSNIILPQPQPRSGQAEQGAAGAEPTP